MTAIILGELDPAVEFVLWLFGIFMGIVWIIFPFVVMGRLRDLISLAEQFSKRLADVNGKLSELSPVMAKPKPDKKEELKPEARVILASFQCPHCEQNMTFDPSGFDPETPPIVPCPGCGQEVEIKTPAMRYQIATVSDHVV